MPCSQFPLRHPYTIRQSRGPPDQRIGARTGQEAECYRRRGAASRITHLAQALELQRVRQRWESVFERYRSLAGHMTRHPRTFITTAPSSAQATRRRSSSRDPSSTPAICTSPASSARFISSARRATCNSSLPHMCPALHPLRAPIEPSLQSRTLLPQLIKLAQRRRQTLVRRLKPPLPPAQAD